ncbi:MAG: alkaline phosphatase family protein [Kofleriaceae bacterium]
MATQNLALYSGGSLGAAQIADNLADVQGSGFTTIILWSFHVSEAGDISFNDTHDIVSKGVYGGDPTWPGNVAALKANGSAVTSVWASVGAGGVGDFGSIGKLIAAEGIGPNSILYRNFAALRDAFTVDGVCAIDGIDFDNEDDLDATVMVEFATMLFGLGFKVTFCPYMAPSIWVDALRQLWAKGLHVSWFNLQAYSGGYGNDPQQWIDAVAPVVGAAAAPSFIVPGLWCYHGQDDADSRCPAQVQADFAAYNQAGAALTGGFLWIYDDVLKYRDANPCGGPATAAAYAQAISTGLAGGARVGAHTPIVEASEACETAGVAVGAQIDHVVMVMLENRGFDSVHGWLYTRASPPARFLPAGGPGFLGLDGTPLPAQRANRGGRWITASPTPSVLGANSPGKDPGEPYKHVNHQLFGSPNPPTHGQRPTMSGFLQDYADELPSTATDAQVSQIMRLFTPQDLPALNALARTYAVSDEWYCSVPTQTNANRAFSICGTSQGLVDNGYYPAGIRGWVFECDKFTAPTIWNVLDQHKVSWGVYYNEPYPPIPPYEAPYTWVAFPEVQKTTNAWQHFHKIDQFFTDAKAGKLPAFSYIEPKWGGETKVSYVDGNDYHPPVDVTHSELMLEQIYAALRSNQAAWQRTLLVVVFDEHGGTYDHVPPPWGATPPWGSNPNPPLPKPRQYGFNFDRFGVRVPCLLASPWIDDRTVVRTATKVPFDHTSILASVLDWKRIDRRSVLGQRVAAAPTFWHVLNRSTPRTDDQAFPPPAHLPTGTVLTFGQPFRLRNRRTGQWLGPVHSGVRYFFPTLGPTPVQLEFRGGFGTVTSGASIQLRTSEAAVNAPGVMAKPANTLGAWKDEQDCYYFNSDAFALYQQQQWLVTRAGTAHGVPLHLGDEVTLSSLFPDYAGQVLCASGGYLTTAKGATDTWIITPV